MAKELTLDAVREMAEEIGLARLSAEHLEQLARSTNTARARARSLRTENLKPSDEPAHVFSVERS